MKTDQLLAQVFSNFSIFLRLVARTPFRAGARLGMVAASERHRLTIPAAVGNTEKPVEMGVDSVQTIGLPSSGTG